MKMFMVGGACRDEIMGRASSDIDFTVVLEPDEVPAPGTAINFDPYEFMNDELERQGFKIFLRTPEFLTTRAQFPRELTEDNFTLPASVFQRRNGLTADFVLARKESGYSDGRRPDKVEPGNLLADLSRRDFGMNAIAKSDTGEFIDPFHGVQDINDRVIRAVGNAFDRLTEDALRAVRALRFSVTLGFRIDHELKFAMESLAVLDAIKAKIADERIKDELNKMFRAGTLESLNALSAFPALTAAMFDGRVNLEATMKQKGFDR